MKKKQENEKKKKFKINELKKDTIKLEISLNYTSSLQLRENYPICTRLHTNPSYIHCQLQFASPIFYIRFAVHNCFDEFCLSIFIPFNYSFVYIHLDGILFQNRFSSISLKCCLKNNRK